MTSVFISHSKRDRDLIQAINSALKNIDIHAIIEEFIPEQLKQPTPYKEIRHRIESCDAVFLFLTDSIMMTEHTKNWVIFEDGIAAASRKQLFLFERQNLSLEYPVPYLTDYMIFGEDKVKDLLTIQAISKQFKKYFSLEEQANSLPPSKITYDSTGMLLWGIYEIFKIKGKRKTLKSLNVPQITCTTCKTSFYYHSPEISTFNCPACRGELLHCGK